MMNNGQQSLLELQSRFQEMEERISRMELRIDELNDNLTRMVEQTPREKQAEKAFYDSITEGGSDS